MGVGKTSGPETFTSLLNDVQHKLFHRLPDDTWFYPGYGKDSTPGTERPSLAEWHGARLVTVVRRARELAKQSQRYC